MGKHLIPHAGYHRRFGRCAVPGRGQGYRAKFRHDNATGILRRLRLRSRCWRASALALFTTGTLVALAVPAFAHIANPGSFTFKVTTANVTLGLLQPPLPAGSMTGQIDSDGNISIPQSSLQVTDEPFSFNDTLSGVSFAVSGTATVESGSITGTLDPGSGAASLSTSIFASVTFTATADGLGYSGTCSVGAARPQTRSL